MMIQNGLDMANLTGDYLKYIKTIEEPIMHNHLSELKHPQWGSIIGYENQIRIAVLKDEMEIWQERMKSGDIFFKTFKRFIFTLESRVKELENQETHSVEERIEYWKAELKDSSTEEQFNELLLYVFTGFFLLMIYDNIYKLGRDSFY